MHGSPASVRALVELAIENRARFAEPGEFTQRAFLNGRIDLTQAEAVRDTIEAQTGAQLRAANAMREGALKADVHSLRDDLLRELATVEASVDFSEEIGELDREAMIKRLDGLQESVEALVAAVSRSRILRRGLRVAIVGRPNSGKSTLMNALLGMDRSIVSAEPGTTRDYVEEMIDLDGMPVVLIDTAGLREGVGEAESEGIRRTRELADSAGLVLFLYDASGGWSQEDQEMLELVSRPNHVLANKVDLTSDQPGFGLPISAKSGEGLEEVCRLIRLFGGVLPDISIAPRNVDPLSRAAAAVLDAMGTLGSNRPVDLASVQLREAISALGEVTGETADADMIARIFRDFCIGK